MGVLGGTDPQRGPRRFMGACMARTSSGPRFPGPASLHRAPWSAEGPRGALQAVHGRSMRGGRCGCHGRLEGVPSCGDPWGKPSVPCPTFPCVQCKLEQQACLSNKQLAVRCEGPCPCPTEQAATSTADGKPGEESTEPPGWGRCRASWHLLQGSRMVEEVCRARGKWQKCRKASGSCEVRGPG